MSIFDIFKKKEVPNIAASKDIYSNKVTSEASNLAAQALREVLMTPEEREIDKSMRKHTIMSLALVPDNLEFRYYKSYDKIAWTYQRKTVLINDETQMLGTPAFMWLLSQRSDAITFCRIMDILVNSMAEIWGEPDIDYSANELIEIIKHTIPSFSIGNEPNSIKQELQWAYMDLLAINRFIHLFETHMSTKSIEELKNTRKFTGEYNSVADLLDACFSNVMSRSSKVQNVVRNTRAEYIEEKAPVCFKVPKLEIISYHNARPLADTEYIDMLDNNELLLTKDAQVSGRRTGRYKPYTLRETAVIFNDHMLTHLASNDKDRILEIINCYKRAYDDGVTEAGNNLALLYIKYTRELEKGKALLRECAEKGCFTAITNYFSYLWREESNYEEAIRFGQTTPIKTTSLAWNMAVLYLRGDHLEGNPLPFDKNQAKTYLQDLTSGNLPCSSSYTFFMEDARTILEHIDDYNLFVVTARDYLNRSVKECIDLDKGSLLAGVYLTDVLEHLRFRMEDGLALRLADDSTGYGDTSRFYLCTKENEDYVEVDEDLEVIPHMIVDKSLYGAWEVYLYSKTRNIYPVFWHGAYRRQKLLFSDSDLGQIKPLIGLDKNIVLNGEKIKPKVWFLGDVAYVSSFYWSEWGGLFKETMKLVFDGNKITEYETIAKENLYKYNCGIMM